MIDSQTERENNRRDVGRRLREAREQQEISLRQIEQELRFHAHQIEAVERGDYEALPDVLWARGILTLYGNYVGLDGEELARRLVPLQRKSKIERFLRRRWQGLIVAGAAFGVAASIFAVTIFFPHNPVTGGAADRLEKIAPGTFLGSEPQRVAIYGETGGTIDSKDNVLVAEVAGDDLGLLSVPASTPVRIPGHGRGSLGDVLAMDRPDLTRQTVAGLTDTEVGYYVVVSTDGVKEIVGSVGGVMVDVPSQVSGRVSPGQPMLTLRPGPQKLDADQAVVYLKASDLETDAGTARRQQTFLYAMFRQALGPSNLLANPGTVGVVSENVETNMGKIQMVQLAGRALHLAGSGETLNMTDADDF